MKIKYIYLILSIIPILFCSCTNIGIRHYYKSQSSDWIELDCDDYKNSTAIYRIEKESQMFKTNLKDSFSLKEIVVNTDNYNSNCAFGLFYVPIFPDILRIIWGYQGDFYIEFDLALLPRNSNIKFNDVRFYVNNDTNEIKPIKTDYFKNFQSFTYNFSMKTTKV